MGDPSMSYVVDAIRRIGAEYQGLKDELREVRSEIKLLFEDNRRRDVERSRFQKEVFEIILRCRNAPNVGSHSRLENCSTQPVDFDNNEARVCESVSLPYGSEKKVPKSEVYSIQKDDVVRRTSKSSFRNLSTYESSPCCGRGSFKTKDGDAESKSVGKRPIDEVSSGLEQSKFGACSQFATIRHKFAPESVYIGKATAVEVECGYGKKYPDCYGGQNLLSNSNKTNYRRLNTVEATGARLPKYKVGPFNLTIQLKVPSFSEVIEYIFDEDMEKSEYIVQTAHNHIDRCMMLCLKPRGYVFGEVINVVAELLTEYERDIANDKRKNWFLSTRLTDEALGVRNMNGKNGDKLKMLNFFCGNLQFCEKIFIPIHQSHVEHWLLFVVFVHEGIVQIWDSYLRDGESTGRWLVEEVMRNLDVYLGAEIAKHKPIGWSFTKFSVVTIRKVPQQANTFDCGIYVINFMEQRDWSMVTSSKFNSDDHRARVVLNLVTSSQNLNKDKLCSDARNYYRTRSTTGSFCIGSKVVQSRYKKAKVEE